MTTVTCRRCGHSFETAAVTNTRCRQCRAVVNVGRRRAGVVSPSIVPTETPSDTLAPAETPAIAPTEGLDQTAGVVIALAVAVYAAIVIVRALRRRRASRNTATPVDDSPRFTLWAPEDRPGPAVA